MNHNKNIRYINDGLCTGPWYYHSAVTLVLEGAVDTREMWSGVVVLLLFSAGAASGFQLVDSNGWVPVTDDVIFNQIRREIHKSSPRYTKADDVGIQTDALAVPYHYTRENLIGGDITDYFSYNNEVNNEQFEDQPQHDYHARSLKSTDNQITVSPLRRSKKLAYSHSRDSSSSLMPRTDSELRDKQNNFEKSQENNDGTNTYEVKEITAEDTNPAETEFKEVGHEYPARKQNFTNGLIEYLSKYNIKHDDNLQNYALSRRAKAVYPGKPNREDKTIRFRVPIRYNSSNHLPVDPLLAVFLSNYGYYLQGQYGIQKNYNNLYGYLASNNIHNNRPSGAYKLVSDSD